MALHAVEGCKFMLSVAATVLTHHYPLLVIKDTRLCIICNYITCSFILVTFHNTDLIIKWKKKKIPQCRNYSKIAEICKIDTTNTWPLTFMGWYRHSIKSGGVVTFREGCIRCPKCNYKQCSIGEQYIKSYDRWHTCTFGENH